MAGNASPVPQPMLAVLMPRSITGRCRRAELSPGSKRAYAEPPMRCGRSTIVGNKGSEYGDALATTGGRVENDAFCAANAIGAATALRRHRRMLAAAPAAPLNPRPCHIAPSFAPHANPALLLAYTAPPNAARRDSDFESNPRHGCSACSESPVNCATASASNPRRPHAIGRTIPARLNARRYRSTSPPTGAPSTAPAGPRFDCHCAASADAHHSIAVQSVSRTRRECCSIGVS